jgi:hypothetical protein
MHTPDNQRFWWRRKQRTSGGASSEQAAALLTETLESTVLNGSGCTGCSEQPADLLAADAARLGHGGRVLAGSGRGF